MTRFFQFHLRTTEVVGARAFYSAVLGNDDTEIFPLHEQALARGARPHWLGYLDVPDVDAAAAAFVARGAAHLGPKWVNAAGLEAAVMRDPGGAVVALARPAPGVTAANILGPDVAWVVLHTADVNAARANHADLFGWEFSAPLEVAGLGVVHPFAWAPGEATAGWMTDVTGRPGLHAHWLFHFRVTALDPALEAARAGGGLVLGPFVTPGGGRVAVCDDPQGAAFALLEGD